MTCPYAENRYGSPTVFCKLSKDSRQAFNEMCGHQRFCPQQQRYILSDAAAECRLRKAQEPKG
mgnify:CR=1 FL=1